MNRYYTFGGRWSLRLTLFLILTVQSVSGQNPSKPIDDPSQRISAQVSVVSVNVVVLDKFGFPVSGLTSEAFEIYEDNRKQELTYFQETTEPMKVLMIIDSSGSTHKRISLIKQGAIEFIRRLHDSRPQDQIAIVNFNDDITLMAPFGSTWRQQSSLIQDRITASGGTALYDALYLSAKDILSTLAGRKTTILYTDGIDNKSLKTFQQAFQLSLETDTTFHVITVDNRKQSLEAARKDYYALSRQHYYAFIQGESESVDGLIEPTWTQNMRLQFSSDEVLDLAYRLSYQRLQRLSGTSGGTFSKVDDYDSLPNIYRKIASELPYYYTLTYRPEGKTPAAGTFRSINIRMVDPELEARHRRGYFVK